MAVRLRLYDSPPVHTDRSCWLDVILPSGQGKVVGHSFEIPWYVLRFLTAPPMMWIEVEEMDGSTAYYRSDDSWKEMETTHYGNGVQGEPTQHKGAVEDCPAPECGQGEATMSTALRIQALSKWIDEAPANLARDPEAQTWGRLSKLIEESGEVIEAYIGVTGQNPRKGQYGDMTDVQNEVLDVALTALCAYEHLTGNNGQCMTDFIDFVLSRYKRVLE